METTTPGYKSLGFYLTLIATAGAAAVAGGANFGPAGSGVALGLTALAAAGYTAFRAFKKSDDPTKPAWKTTEFWLSVGAAVVSALYASGVISAGGTAEKVIGVVAMLLTALGYQVTKHADPAPDAPK